MAEEEIVVLDTSVVIKWFSDEVYTEQALEIRSWYVDNRIGVFVPDLLVYELSNALRYNPDYDAADVKKAVTSVFDMDFEIVTPSESMISSSVEIADENDLTVYDSTYIALAKTLNAKVITADDEISEHSDAVHVEDWADSHG
jgi:predicted nucleic acid-binding protein